MGKRKIITIDDSKCDGCGLCIPNCPEGAIRIINNKARLISDLFCDGLGACLGHCPKGAIKVEEREAAAYDEKKVMENIVKGGPDVIKAHLVHLREHNETGYLKEATDYLKERRINIILEAPGGGIHHPGHACPGSKMMDFRQKKSREAGQAAHQDSELSQWPVQLRLVPVHAPYFDNADLLITADCVPFAYANFHRDLLKNKIILVGCPKLDDIASYQEKLKQIFKENKIRSVAYAHMEVPCCFGLLPVIEDALSKSGKDIPFEEIVISIKGERL